MGFIGSAPYFCMAAYTVTDLENDSMKNYNTAPPYIFDGTEDKRSNKDSGTPNLENYVKWEIIPCNRQATEMEIVSVYIDYFMLTI